MAAIHRLKKQGPLDVWSIRERLCLASSVMRSGDQNWVSVSRAIKPFGELNRPPDWFSQKNCALQYSDLLEKVETPKRKRSSDRGEIETPGDQIVRKLTIERIEELKRLIQNQQQQYRKRKRDVEMVKSGQMDTQLQEIWLQIQEKEKASREAAAQRLAQEAAARSQAHVIKPLLRPPGCVGKPKKPPVRHLRYGQGRRNSTQSEQSEQESAAESPDIGVEVVEEESHPSDITAPISVSALTPTTPASLNKPKTPPTSPLLTSLLKNYNQSTFTTPNKTEFHEMVEETHPLTLSNVINPSTNKTPGNLIFTSSNDVNESVILAPKTLISPPEVLTPIKVLTPVPIPSSPSAGAPTLSKLLGAPPITNPKIHSPPSAIAPLPTPHLIPPVEPVVNPVEPSDPLESMQVDLFQPSEDSSTTTQELSPIVESEATTLEFEEKISEAPLAEAIPLPEPESAPADIKSTETEIMVVIKTEPIEEPTEMEVCPTILEPKEEPPAEKSEERKTLLSDAVPDVVVKEDKEKEAISIESTSPTKEIVKSEDKLDKEVLKAKLEPETSSLSKETESLKEIEPASPASSESSKISDGSSKPPKKKVGRKRKHPKFPRNKFLKIAVEENKEETSTGSTSISDFTVPTNSTVSSTVSTASINVSTVVSTSTDTMTSDSSAVFSVVSITETNTLVYPSITAANSPVLPTETPASDITAAASETVVRTDSSIISDTLNQTVDDGMTFNSFEIPNSTVVSCTEPVSTEVTSTISDSTRISSPSTSTISLSSACILTTSEVVSNVSTSEITPTTITTSVVTVTSITTPTFSSLSILSNSSKPSTPTKIIPPVMSAATTPSSQSCVPSETESIKEEPGQSEGIMSSDEDQTIPDSDDMSNLEKSQSVSVTDSIPNSPASVFRDEENQRDYKSWKKAIMLVWRAAANHKFANVFLHPVTDEVAPGYHSIVFRPMDLSTVKKNIENGVIRTTGEFQRDVMLMFQNAIMYNNSDHDVYHMAIEMQKEVIRIIQDFLATQLMLQTTETKVLRIREHGSRRSDSSEKRSASLPSEESTILTDNSRPPEKEEDKENGKRKSTEQENVKGKKRRTRGDEPPAKE